MRESNASDMSNNVNNFSSGTIEPPELEKGSDVATIENLYNVIVR